MGWVWWSEDEIRRGWNRRLEKRKQMKRGVSQSSSITEGAEQLSVLISIPEPGNLSWQMLVSFPLGC